MQGKANSFFTSDNSAFDNIWPVVDSVWINPPYGKLMGKAVAKFIEEYKAGTFKSGILLCNNSTDTKWFKSLAEYTTAFCFTDHRIAFYNKDSKNMSSNTRGQIFLYFGQSPNSFKENFSEHGLVLSKF